MNKTKKTQKCVKTKTKTPAKTKRNITVKGKTTTQSSNRAVENILKGATNISLTKNKIVATTVTSTNTNGMYKKTEERRYIDKTPENINALNEVIKSKPINKISVKR